MAEGSGCPALHCSSAASTGVLCAVLGSVVQKGHKTIKECLKEDDKDDEESGRQGIWGPLVCSAQSKAG